MLKDGQPIVTTEDLKKLANKEIDFSFFVKHGMIEFVDAEEEEDLFIAMNPENITPEHTHLEIDPSLILGIGAAHVPFPEHNASPRVTMGAGMVKQALGFGCANMKLRPDTRGHQLHYVQKPLTHTQTSELIGSDDRQLARTLLSPFSRMKAITLKMRSSSTSHPSNGGLAAPTSTGPTKEKSDGTRVGRSTGLRFLMRKSVAHTVQTPTRTSMKMV